MTKYLPLCDFKYCKYNFDGNCTSKIKYKKCEYNLVNKILKDILIQNNGCVYCKTEYCSNCKNYSMYQIDLEKVIKNYGIELEDD